jgi:S1-C subfamily serine protease
MMGDWEGRRIMTGNSHGRTRSIEINRLPSCIVLFLIPAFVMQKSICLLFTSILATASANSVIATTSETPSNLPPQLAVPSPTPENILAETTVHKPTPSGAVENSVVKVFSSMRAPDLWKPWAKQASTEVTGSGVVIEGKRILTNAHVVVFSSEIQVQANQAGDRISATLEGIAPGIDLAVLRLEDDKFFDTHQPLPRAEKLPDIKDAVMVYGYPVGGTSLSVTKGIVSRVEFVPYNFPTSGLRIQLDAAINPGNSGGPAIVDDKMIGLAFSHLGGAENIGYVIPCEEINLFLREIADGKYDGKPGFYEEWQTLENPALRSFLHLGDSVQGVIIRRPFSDDASYPLKQWDVITSIGETPIDDQGMVKIEQNLRVHFPYLVQHVAKNGKAPLTIVRNGKQMHVDLPAPADYPLVIRDWGNSYPSYFIFGPIVFCEATAQIVSSLTTDPKNLQWLMYLVASGSPLIKKYGEKQDFPGERLVYVSSPFFPQKLSKGYGKPILKVVQSVNHHPVKNLASLIEIIRDSEDAFITIECAGRTGETWVFPRKEMISATEDILTDNGIRSQGSPDMMLIWMAHPALK